MFKMSTIFTHYQGYLGSLSLAWGRIWPTVPPALVSSPLLFQIIQGLVNVLVYYEVDHTYYKLPTSKLQVWKQGDSDKGSSVCSQVPAYFLKFQIFTGFSLTLLSCTSHLSSLPNCQPWWQISSPASGSGVYNQFLRLVKINHENNLTSL